jgi:hypothetical protein
MDRLNKAHLPESEKSWEDILNKHIEREQRIKALESVIAEAFGLMCDRDESAATTLLMNHLSDR